MYACITDHYCARADFYLFRSGIYTVSACLCISCVSVVYQFSHSSHRLFHSAANQSS